MHGIANKSYTEGAIEKFVLVHYHIDNIRHYATDVKQITQCKGTFLAHYAKSQAVGRDYVCSCNPFGKSI